MKYTVSVNMTVVLDDEEFTTACDGEVISDFEDALTDLLHEHSGIQVVNIEARDTTDD